jgi:hypothetical protein
MKLSKIVSHFFMLPLLMGALGCSAVQEQEQTPQHMVVHERNNPGVIFNQVGEHVAILIPVSLVFYADSANFAVTGAVPYLGAYVHALVASYEVPEVRVTAFVPQKFGEYVESIGSAQAHAVTALISEPSAPAPVMLTGVSMLGEIPYADSLKDGYIRIDFSFVPRYKKVT